MKINGWKIINAILHFMTLGLAALQTKVAAKAKAKSEVKAALATTKSKTKK